MIEQLAFRFLADAGCGPLDTPGGLALARATDVPVIRYPVRGADAASATVGGRRVILVRPRLPARRLHFLICHELAELHLEQLGYRGSDVELVANSLAAALLVPANAYYAALRKHGPRWQRLSLLFSTTETAIALRHGEVTDAPIAVVSPAAARVRGAWTASSDASELRRMARRPGPGLAAARLTDDRRRFVLADGISAIAASGRRRG